MMACNARPPVGHPFHGSLIACHHQDGHLEVGQPHSWDIDAAVARHEIVAGAAAAIRERFGPIDRFDVNLPAPIVCYEVDASTGERASAPYRVWDQAAGPWLLAKCGATQLAIWKETGDVYVVRDGAVLEEPVIGRARRGEARDVSYGELDDDRR